jgi:hypothetical protein
MTFVAGRSVTERLSAIFGLILEGVSCGEVTPMHAGNPVCACRSQYKLIFGVHVIRFQAPRFGIPQNSAVASGW